MNFDNEASITATVVEVRGTGPPGLALRRRDAPCSNSGLSISSAMVATYGERAVDVFYVRDGYGHKVAHPDAWPAVDATLAQGGETADAP